MPGGIYGALTRGAQSWPALRRSLASRSEGLPEEFPKELPQ